MLKRRSWWAVVLGAVLVITGCGGSDGDNDRQQPQKIIIDSDYNTMSDDGQVGVMTMQLQGQGLVQVMGITVVSGNQWLAQGVADALKSVERMGMADKIGVYAGNDIPLSHPFSEVQAEEAAGFGGDGYLGAWSSDHDGPLRAPRDGFATTAKVQSQSAVDFIVETVKANPNEITILAIGPLSNIAIATERNPEIIPLIKQIIYMGGAVHVPGNTTKTAEFNFWFDPLSAQKVLRLPIKHVLVPLDVTDTVLLDKTVYDRVAHPANPTIVSQLFQDTLGLGFDGLHGFENDPAFTINIWDSLTVAYLLDPSYATQTSEEWVDVTSRFGAENGRSVGYVTAPPAGVPLQKMTVVSRFDNARFYELFVHLMTMPVPVAMP